MIFLFGSGGIYRTRKDYIDSTQVIGILDNDPKKQGSYIDGHLVMNPADIVYADYEAVYIMTDRFKEVKSQLISLGCPSNKIYSYVDIPVKAHEIECYSICEQSDIKSKIYIITNTFGESGAPRCLLMMSKILIKNHYDVIVVAREKGNMLDAFLQEGVSIYIDEWLITGKMTEIVWLSDAALIIVNTNQLYYLLRDTYETIPVVWWLHEPPLYYQNDVMLEYLKKLNLRENTYVWAVSEVAKAAISKYIGDKDIMLFPYGIEDRLSKKTDENRNKMRFIAVAAMHEIKGYDVLLGAIGKLSSVQRKQCQFVFVGENNTEIGHWVKRECEIKNITAEIMGFLPNQNVIDLIAHSDVLICASYQETLSMAATEACMLEKTVICSNGTGIAHYMTEGENALIFERGNADELAEKITWVLDNRGKISSIGENARKLYKKFFSMDSFERRLLKFLESIVVEFII